MNKHPHKHHDDELITIKEYHKANMMLFNTKELKTTDTVLCTLTSIDRMSFLPNGIEHHECKRSELSEHFLEVVKRNLILAFFDKIEIEPFDVLDVQTEIDFLFE
ncbi:hypothetical protein [Ochrovirga pacifica]|uniref:hypothetical protein n=1 Tax=Ochrovirga pacifica TaxID=1042376 RepID=UPI000255A024|nr:hypothetical protein [Ochrovirga pacifica]